MNQLNYGPAIVHTPENPFLGDSYKYQFGGKEFQDEFDINTYDFGARNYNPALGRWMNVDPLAEKYPGWSPYNYTMNNPIVYIDPDGNYVDYSFIYAKNDDGSYKNQNLVDAFNAFAGTKEGIAFLSNYAEKGQIIAGTKYTKNGQFHNKKIDLVFGDLENGGHIDSTTSLEECGGRLNISINLKKNQTIDSYIENIGHEGFVHGDKFAVDYADNQQIDFSAGIDKDIVEYVNSHTNKEKTRFNHHFQERRDNVLEKKLAPILSQYYDRNGINKTDREVKDKVNEFAD